MSISEIKNYTHQETRNGKRDINVMVTETFVSANNQSQLMHGHLENGRSVTLKFPNTDFAYNEYLGLSLLTNNGIRAPQPIAFITRDEVPKNGLIMERINGVTLYEAPSPKNRFLLGRAVRKMHDISVEGFGLVNNGSSQFQSGEEYIASVISDLTPYAQNNKDGLNLLYNLWNKVEPHGVQQSPKFIHRDLKDKNVMLDQAGDITLIDLEYWNGGDPMWDVGGYLFFTLRTGESESTFIDFLQGYTDGQEPTDNQKLNTLFYSLLSAGRFLELVAQKDPANIDYAIRSMNTVSSFIKKKVQ